MIATTLEQVKLVGTEWEEVRARIGRIVPNTDPERFIATVQAMGTGVVPHVALLERGAGLVVGREQMRRERHRVGYLSIPGARLRCLDIVYEGLLVAPGEDAADAAVQYLSGKLRNGVDVVTINHLRLDSPLLPRLIARNAEIENSELHWVLPLAGSLDATLHHRTGKHRGNLRRMDRKLCEHFNGDLTLVEYSSADDVEKFLDAASPITAASYHGAIGAGASSTPIWRAVLGAEAAAGRWLAYVLTGGGRPVAYETGVVHNGTFFLEATSFRPELRQLGPGTVLLTRVVAALCAQGVERIDFGFGDAEYKRSNATESWEEATVRMYARRFGAQVSRGVGSVARMLGHNQGPQGLRPRVKALWRSALTRR